MIVSKWKRLNSLLLSRTNTPVNRSACIPHQTYIPLSPGSYLGYVSMVVVSGALCFLILLPVLVAQQHINYAPGTHLRQRYDREDRNIYVRKKPYNVVADSVPPASDPIYRHNQMSQASSIQRSARPPKPSPPASDSIYRHNQMSQASSIQRSARPPKPSPDRSKAAPIWIPSDHYPPAELHRPCVRSPEYNNVTDLTPTEDSLVRIGDRSVTVKQWRLIQHVFNSWTAPEGNWTDQPHRPPMIRTVLPDDQSLVTQVYSACGPVEKRKGLTYWWEPAAPITPLVDVSLKLACEVMRGRNLIFLGDSLSQHHYESTINVLGVRKNHGTERGAQLMNETFDECESQYGLPAFTMYRVMRPEVWKFDEEVQTLLLNLECRKQQSSVVVVNWGAFVATNEDVQKFAALNLQWFQSHMPSALVLFRTSSMAHLNCGNYQVPDNVLHEPVPNPRHANWHWERFPPQRSIWIEEIEQRRPGILYLDIFPLSSKRPDQHPGNHDCLHYCIPGPYETWVRLIFSALAYVESIPRHLPSTNRTS